MYMYLYLYMYCLLLSLGYYYYSFVEFSDKIEEGEKRIKELETLEDKYKEITEAHITLKYKL